MNGESGEAQMNTLFRIKELFKLDGFRTVQAASMHSLRLRQMRMLVLQVAYKIRIHSNMTFNGGEIRDSNVSILLGKISS